MPRTGAQDAAATGAMEGERLHALDAVRAAALLLGVVYHAAFAFAPGPPAWMVRDSQSSDLLAGLAFTIHSFRMTLFFLVAGFFARLLFQSRGPVGFARNRLQRVLVPFLLAWIALIPLTLLICDWGAERSYDEAVWGPTPDPNIRFGIRTVPLSFLWFLSQLMALYVISLMLHALSPRFLAGKQLGELIDKVFARTLSTPLVIFVLAAPATLALWSMDDWTLWRGIPAPDSGLPPKPVPTICYGFAFAVGWFLQRQAGLLRAIEKLAPDCLVIALVMTVVCVGFAGFSPALDSTPDDVSRFCRAFCYSLAGWTWTLAIIGFAMRYLSRPSRTNRYLADASYWIYLTHVPLILLLQGMTFDWTLPGEIKVVIILGMLMPVMFVSYHFMVRNTLVGQVLNGRRIPPRAKALDKPDATAPANARHV